MKKAKYVMEPKSSSDLQRKGLDLGGKVGDHPTSLDVDHDGSASSQASFDGRWQSCFESSCSTSMCTRERETRIGRHGALCPPSADSSPPGPNRGRTRAMTASAPTSAVGTLGGRPNSSWESDDGSRVPEPVAAFSAAQNEAAPRMSPRLWQFSIAVLTRTCRMM